MSRARLPFACNDTEEDRRQHAVPTAASLFALSDDEHADNITTQSSVPAGWMDRPRDAAHSSASLSLLRDTASLMSSFEERSSASQEHTTSRQSRKRKKQVSPTRKQPPTSPHPAHRHAYSPHSTSMSPFASLPPLSPYSSSPFSVSPPLYYPPLPPVPPLFGSPSLLDLYSSHMLPTPTPPPAHSHHSRGGRSSLADASDSRHLASLHKWLNDTTAAHLSHLASTGYNTAEDIKPTLPVSSSSLFSPPMLTSPPTSFGFDRFPLPLVEPPNYFSRDRSSPRSRFYDFDRTD